MKSFKQSVQTIGILSLDTYMYKLFAIVMGTKLEVYIL